MSIKFIIKEVAFDFQYLAERIGEANRYTTEVTNAIQYNTYVEAEEQIKQMKGIFQIEKIFICL